MAAYAEPSYLGGLNQPEQVTDEHLTCYLCNKPGFRKSPKILNCGHTFCEPCLDGYTNHGRVRDICCPICAQPTPMPQKCIQGLPNNMFVATQIDRLLRHHNNAKGRENGVYRIEEHRSDQLTNNAYFDKTC